MTEDSKRYKWSTSATNLLVTIWCHDLVQKQLKMSTRNQPIWESIARYMSRKGYSVTGIQCKTRIKNMLCSYHESVRKNEVTGSEPYFDIFKKVLGTSPKKSSEGPQDVGDLKSRAAEDLDGSEEAKEECDFQIESNDLEMDSILVQETKDGEYQMEFLDMANNDCHQSSITFLESEMKTFQKIIVEAIEKQTQTITSAINAQSQIMEKWITAERDQLEARRRLEVKLDRLLDKIEMNIIPQTTYMGTLIETSPE